MILGSGFHLGVVVDDGHVEGEGGKSEEEEEEGESEGKVESLKESHGDDDCVEMRVVKKVMLCNVYI